MFFEYPKLLWLLIIPALLVLHYLYLELKERIPHFRVSIIVPWIKYGSDWTNIARHFPFILRLCAITLIIILAVSNANNPPTQCPTRTISLSLNFDKT